MNYTAFGEEYEVYLEFNRYADNGATAIQLMSDEEGPIATATVNPVDEEFDRMVKKDGGHRFVCIKDYSENEGMTQFLMENNVIKPDLITWIPSGFVLLGAFELTEEYAKQAV